MCLVSEILLSSLERYAAAPREELTDREARRRRAAEGVGLSQMEAFTQADDGEDGGGKGEDGSPPFRFEKVVSASPRSAAGDQGRRKKAKPSSAGRAMLDEALGRIEEPLALLVASCAAVSSLVEEEDDTKEGAVEDETRKALCRLRRQLAGTDVDACVRWVKKSRTLHGIQDNGKRAEQMAVARIATLIVVSTLCEVFMGTCQLGGDGPDDEAVEDLFSLRCDAIDEAAKIMSSFAVRKKTAGKKKKGGEKKKKLKDRNENNSQEDEDGDEPPAEKKKARGKKDDAATAAVVLTRLKSDEVSDAAIEKNKHLLEETVLGLCPALSQEFLAGSMRRFGAGALNKVSFECMSRY